MTGYTAKLTNQAPNEPNALKRWREAVSIRSLRIETEKDLSSLDEKNADLLTHSSDVQVQERYICGNDKMPGHRLSGYLQRDESNQLKLMQAELKCGQDAMEVFVERHDGETITTVSKMAGSELQGQWTLQEDAAKGTLFIEFVPPGQGA